MRRCRRLLSNKMICANLISGGPGHVASWFVPAMNTVGAKREEHGTNPLLVTKPHTASVTKSARTNPNRKSICDVACRNYQDANGR